MKSAQKSTQINLKSDILSKRFGCKCLGLIFTLTIISACADPKHIWNSIDSWQSPISVTTYDEYMSAASEKVNSGDSKTAIDMYRKAVEEAKSEYGPYDLRIATSASYLASYYASLGLFGEAETYYKEALTVDQAALGANNPETIRVKNALADVLVKLFKVDEANRLLKKPKSGDKKSTVN
jgi:tetratricopeptide (TPR) repeat protein